MVKNMQMLVTNSMDIIEEIKINKEIGIIYNFNDNKVNLNNVKEIYLAIDEKYILDKKLLKKYIKYLIKLKKKIDKRKLQFGILYKNDRAILTIINSYNIPLEKYTEIETCLKALQYDNKKERYEYIYDIVCDYLDDDNRKNNYCDFKNDICVAKRDKKNIRKNELVDMGCCHKYNHFNICGKMRYCEYLENKCCTIKCISCKLLMCDYTKVKYKIEDIPLLDCFFNIIQKLIIKNSFFTPKEKIIKKLLLF